jgi:hypothetical protein
MQKLGLALLVLTAAVGTLGAQSGSDQTPGRNRSDRAAPPGSGAPQPRIVNRVLDLLDEPVELESSADDPTWQSRPFDTAQFTRAGLRVATESGSDPVTCSLWWQFTAEDEFLPAPAERPTAIGDDSRLDPVVSGPVVFSSIFGLRARAVCRVVFPDFGQVPPPPPSAAVLTDVKVLLRRE